MLNLSRTICRRVAAIKEPLIKDSSNALGLLLRRWVTETTAGAAEAPGAKKLGDKRGSGFHLYSYILASHQLEVGSVVMNCDLSKPSKGGTSSDQAAAYCHGILDPNSQVGNCLPLGNMRMGTWVHDIECHPGQGAKLARSAGTFAKVVKEPGAQCLVRLPSGVEKVLDSRCRATVGVASNPNHGVRKLRKAGNSRWLGRRPVVRGVAMNPVDHPHGGGEGRTKGGRPSVSPGEAHQVWLPHGD